MVLKHRLKHLFATLAKRVWYDVLLSLTIFVIDSHAQNKNLTLYLEEGKSGTVWDIAINKNGTRIYSCGRDSSVKVWNGVTGECIRIFRAHYPTLNTCLSLTPDEKYLVVGDMNGSIHIWDLATDILFHAYNIASGYVTDVGISVDGQNIISAGRDDSVRVWDFAGRVIKQFHAKSIWINCITVSKIGNLLATAGQDGSIKLWNLLNGELITQLGNHSRFARSITFSTDGAFLLSGGRDGMIKVWDVVSHKLVREMKMINGFPRHLSLSSDGNILVISAMNHLIETWDWKRGLLLRKFEAHSYGAMASALNSDATRLYSAHTDGSIKIWNFPHASSIASMVGFSDGQWITFTQDGYFDCSSHGSRYAQWKQDEDFFPFELYEELYHKPAIIEDALAGKYFAHASLSRVVEPPRVRIITPREKQLYSFGSEPLEVVVEVEETDKIEIGSDDILVNGRLLTSNQIIEKKVISDSRSSKVVRYKIAVLPGQNIIEAVAYNASRIRSDPARVAIQVETDRVFAPNLFVLAVGIDGYAPTFPDLQFASIDAKNITEAFSQQEGKLFTRVYSTCMTNKDATKENILKAIERFPAMYPNDILILFFSGHGVRMRNTKGDTKYFFVSAGATPENMLYRGLSWDDFASQISKVGAGRVLLFLDACHSGDVSNSASNEKVAANIARNMGIVFASSSGNEFSFENSEWGHGAFTKAILDALSGKGDYTKDDKIDWSELQLFVISEVRKLTKGSQNPMIPRLEQFTNFDLVRLK